MWISCLELRVFFPIPLFCLSWTWHWIIYLFFSVQIAIIYSFPKFIYFTHNSLIVPSELLSPFLLFFKLLLLSTFHFRYFSLAYSQDHEFCLFRVYIVINSTYLVLNVLYFFIWEFLLDSFSNTWFQFL